MFTPAKRWWSVIAGGIPPLLVCGALAGVGYWGATTGWKADKFSALFPRVAEFIGVSAADAVDDDDKPADMPVMEKVEGPADWCEKHGVADSLCPDCHPDLIAGPKGHRPWSSADDVAIQPSHDPKQCRTHLEVIRFPSAEAAQLAGVKTASATVRSLAETVTAYGVAEYDEFQTARIAPRTAGTVWAVYKRRGESVRAGDVVALIDAAEVGKAKSEFLQAAVQLDTRARARALLQPERSPEKAIQEADAALREARARLFTAQQELLTLGLPLRGDEAGLPDDQLRSRLQFLGIPEQVVKTFPAHATANLLPLVAPFAGSVVDGIAVRGQTVAAREPLFTVSDLTSLHVLLDFRPEDAPRLSVGQRVEFHPDGDAGPPAVGEMHWISPAVDEKTRMVHAHAEVPNPNGRLRANAFGTATVTVATHEAAVVVPAEAVQWEGCSYVVFVADSATAFRPRKVRLGLRHDGSIEILIGLKPGETVATAGSHVLKSHLFRDRLGAAEE